MHMRNRDPCLALLIPCPIVIPAPHLVLKKRVFVVCSVLYHPALTYIYVRIWSSLLDECKYALIRCRTITCPRSPEALYFFTGDWDDAYPSQSRRTQHCFRHICRLQR